VMKGRRPALGRNFIGCDIVFDGSHGEAHESDHSRRCA
jgi:hypothetical protein